MRIFDRFFYHPSNERYASPEDYNIAYESVNFRTSDNLLLHGWFLPARHTAKGTVLHLHGNAGNITAHFPFIAWLPSSDWNVLCFDYRGYGQSEGSVTREGTLTDAHAALDCLLQREDVNAGHIVVFGQSLGSALGIVLTAQREEVSGIVAYGGFDHYRNVAAWHIRHSWLLPFAWWAPWLMSDELNPVDYVDRIAPRPLLVMHGTADRIVPVRMAHNLYHAAGEPKELYLFDGADHYEAMNESPEQVYRKVDEFFTHCLHHGRDPLDHTA
jgi:hypothetical protein